VTLSSQTRPLWTAIVGVPLLFALIALLQVRIDARTRSVAQQNEEMLLRSGRLVRKLSLGYEALLADIYWTRAVQYYGARVGTPDANFELLWPMLDLTTTLDPKLIPAYRFGAIFLSETGEAGAGRTDLAIELIKRGIAANPEQWRLDTDLGFLYYWRLRDYRDAAAAYLEASKNPQAPEWAKLMVARVSEKGGSFETSSAIWLELYDSTSDPNIRRKAIEQLRMLRAREDQTRLDELADQYRKRSGRLPVSTQEMRDAGLLNGIPADPDGFPYVLGLDGKSHLNPASSFVLPPEPSPPSASK
jgi:tetratricopeptide (TPR) repeat protein